jgi:sulfatase maturation enzyme AslB (radical SAM superfamily)
MADSKIFCNVPWTNTHIYWDGSFGVCCSETGKPYTDNQRDYYNLSNMTVSDWYKSKPINDIRTAITGKEKLSICRICYHEESLRHESRRIKENFKSVIFTDHAFDKSYKQSPWFNKFESDQYNTTPQPPLDWHVDLGNECNLSCKMCSPAASSQIFNRYVNWGLTVDRRKNWTNDETSWNNFLISIDNSSINRLHFMGGEPMINKRLFQIIDYLLDKNRTNISISFVTNGTILNQDFVNKLKLFKSCDIEISLESVDKNNNYIRQGPESTTNLVKPNIEKLISQQTNTFKIVMRSVPQLLNVNNYHQYILWAWQKQVSIQSIPLITPNYLSILVLPAIIRKEFVENYKKVKDIIQKESNRTFSTIATGRDTSRLDIQLIKECDSIISILLEPEPVNIKLLQTELAIWLIRWDKEFNLNAYDYYPEYTEFLQSIGYEI